MEISKQDLKIFKDHLPNWQEQYMEKLIKSYIDLLTKDDKPSSRFWELRNRIEQDRREPGVSLEIDKFDIPISIVRLVRDEVISVDDLNLFSEELKDYVNSMLCDRL